MNKFDYLKSKLDQLERLKRITYNLNKINENLKNNSLNECSKSGDICDNYCKIKTQLIDSFECFHKKSVNKKQFKCFWPKCHYKCENSGNFNKHKNIHLNKRQFVCDFNECQKTFIQNI